MSYLDVYQDGAKNEISTKKSVFWVGTKQKKLTNGGACLSVNSGIFYHYSTAF